LNHKEAAAYSRPRSICAAAVSKAAKRILKVVPEGLLTGSMEALWRAAML